MESTDLLILIAIILSRLFIPLLILRYPLPGIITALLLDAVDHPILFRYTSIDMDGYQGFDKALDIYYLTIAYISTMRNWNNYFAFKASQFLFYYRLIGIALFELTQLRPLLIMFPNTFEYFFIFYEAVRLRWDPNRMSKKLMIGAIAFIWIFVKLPQEYILHIAQVDFTAWFNTYIFNVTPLNTPISQSIFINFTATLMILLITTALIGIAWWIIKTKLPAADWKVKFGIDVPEGAKNKAIILKDKARPFSLKDGALWEKVAMLSLLSIIFAQILPGINATNIQIAVGVLVVIVLNTLVSHWFATRGIGWSSMFKEFFAMGAVNFILVFSYSILIRGSGTIHLGNTLFFVFLITLLVTMFDRYRVIFEKRFNII